MWSEKNDRRVTPDHELGLRDQPLLLFPSQSCPSVNRLLLRSSYSLASVFFPFVPYVTHFSHPLISFESERSEGRNEGRMTDRAEGTTRGPVPGS